MKKGSKHTIETKRKMSEAKKGKKNPMYGKYHSEETNTKHSETLKEGYALGKYSISPSMKDKHHSAKSKLKTSNSLIGHSVSDESKLKNSISHIGKKHTFKTKKKMQKKRIEYMSTHIGKFMDTLIELKIKNQLADSNINFVYQYLVDDKFLCDFYLPDNNLIIEAGCL